jgi:hypothetical protein
LHDEKRNGEGVPEFVDMFGGNREIESEKKGSQIRHDDPHHLGNDDETAPDLHRVVQLPEKTIPN